MNVDNSKAKEVDVKFTNPNASESKQWGISLIGANFKDQDGSRVLNISDAFIVNQSGSTVLVGMKKSKWTELAQKLGVDYITIVIPQDLTGKTIFKLYHCPDNATSLSDSRCIKVDQTKVKCSFGSSSTTCDIPTTIGFSVFGVAGSTSGNGGGGGGATPTNVTINATVEDGNVTGTFNKISSGTIGTMVIPDEADVTFEELAIAVKATVTNAEIVIYKLSEKPSAISEDISGETQSYIQLDETNIEAADIDTVTIKFKVPVSWINDNSIDRAKVVLNRYANGTWTALVTTKESEDSSNVHYSASSPGLSTFGVSGEVQTEVPTTAPPTTEAPVTTAPPTTAPPTVAPPEEGGINWVIAILVIAVIAGAAYYFYQKKSGEEGEVEAPKEVQEPAEEPSVEEPPEEEPKE
jgi:PGF-pre-PGF domain-containing protein